ncbi:peptide transporter (plasmid) [Borrelia sp. A-FGy1]|uniref:plasmid maintenance protein n=1 Tax=Borrelia sp. A-FGy1 TaxID=2608247 RepID=UPI0015F53E59|nr:plasmid maintenance protein [Borrelia sp. A-FGy1]QMU99765.1 peptide transporter [Borrelia sp. A-FGy1]
MKNKSKEDKTNRYQSNLVVLISTLNFINLKFNKYTQNNILYFFNSNLKRNNQKTIKMKTLQNYLYKLEKKFKVTLNYCKHLGQKCGSEVYYTLQYPKKECHYKINSHFKNLEKEKIKKFKERIKTNEKENGSLKWECINNINNKREEEALVKYIKKCKFKTKLPFLLLNLKINRSLKIEHIKDIKKHERTINLLDKEELNLLKKKIKENGNERGCIKNFLDKRGYIYKISYKRTKHKKKIEKLKEVLKRVEAELIDKNYRKENLRKEIERVYEVYKEKPHFILEQYKYKDLERIINKIKNKISIYSVQENIDDIKNNIFSILLEQLRYKISTEKLIPALKGFINSENELKYSKLIDNTYHYKLLKMIQ